MVKQRLTWSELLSAITEMIARYGGVHADTFHSILNQEGLSSGGSVELNAKYLGASILEVIDDYETQTIQARDAREIHTNGLV